MIHDAGYRIQDTFTQNTEYRIQARYRMNDSGYINTEYRIQDT